MQTGMLGNSEALRRLWDGPLKTLVVNINGKNGSEIEAELNKFNRREPCWVKTKKEVTAPKRFRVEDTNLGAAIFLAAEFTGRILGHAINHMERYDVPKELPWSNVMAIFDPWLTNREAIDSALKGQSLKVFEDEDVMSFSGSDAHNEREPTLYIIESSVTPNADTLGDNAKSSDQLRAEGRDYLTVRGWALAFGQWFYLNRGYFDPENTFTLFPRNRLSGYDALGCWNSHNHRVEFIGRLTDSSRNSCTGVRLAIRVPIWK